MGLSSKEYKSAAIVTIFRASNMTPKGRMEVAKWLKKQASMLLNHGDEFSSRFTARYLYR